MVPAGYGTRIPPTFIPIPLTPSKEWKKYLKRAKRTKVNNDDDNNNNENENNGNNNEINGNKSNNDIDMNENNNGNSETVTESQA